MGGAETETRAAQNPNPAADSVREFAQGPDTVLIKHDWGGCLKNVVGKHDRETKLSGLRGVRLGGTIVLGRHGGAGGGGPRIYRRKTEYGERQNCKEKQKGPGDEKRFPFSGERAITRGAKSLRRRGKKR